MAEFRTEQVRERAGAPRAPPTRSAKAGASEAPPAKKAGAIEVRPIAPPASTATATASGRGTDPPADWKGLIDKTALLAAAVGPGFEERTLREHDQNKYTNIILIIWSNGNVQLRNARSGNHPEALPRFRKKMMKVLRRRCRHRRNRRPDP